MNETSQYLRQLRQEMANHFGQEELEGLVYDLNVDWDELPGNAKTPKIRSLHRYLIQHNCFPDLITLLRQERPQTLWLDPPPDLTLPRTTPATKEGRIRQALMDKVRAFWIEGVLEKSLYGVARLELGLAYDPEAVERPWMMSLESPHTPAEVIPAGTHMLSLFERLDHALLILGDPGSGKTTLLLELARDLLELAELDERQSVPLVFNLSSWAKKRVPLFAWLVEELNRTYQVNRKFASQWLETEPIHLLLDGLDEVAAESREACVTAINDFRQEYGLTSIAICSRTADYAQLATQLQLPGAVHIQPLTDEQIDHYLAAAGEPLAAVRTVIQTDTALHELAQSPLSLSILTLAYQGYTADQLSSGSLEQRRHHLFTTYVQRMFQRRPTAAAYAPTQAQHWLTYLAHQMAAHSQTLFLLETLQPTWLPLKRQLNIYKVVAGISIGLMIGLGFGLVFWLVFGLALGLASGLGLGLVFGLVAAQNEIKVIEAMSLSWKDIFWGIVGGLIGALFFTLQARLALGLVFGLVFGLVRGLKLKELETKTVPNQGIRLSLFYALCVGLGLGLVSGIAAGLVGGLRDGLNAGLGTALLFGPASGGAAVIQHYTLRYLLHRYNHLPWHLVIFLDNMADHLLLRKVGGGYIFIHRLLLEYFASLYDEDYLPEIPRDIAT